MRDLFPIVRPAVRSAVRGSSYPAEGGSGTSRYPRVTNLALLGDSITAKTSGDSFTFKNFFGDGYGGYLRRRLGARVELVINTETGDYDFGLDGAKASWYLGDSATAVDYLAAALASDADTVLVLLGANDMVDAGGFTGEQCAANIIALWDLIIAAGKNVVSVLPLPQRESATDSANYLARRLACNPILIAAAAARGKRVQIVDATAALDPNSDGFLDTSRSIDSVHPSITGACYLGIAIADAIESRAGVLNLLGIPAQGDARWKTTNPYASGTVGVGNVATGWDASSVVVSAKELIARTDGVAGNWQQLTIDDTGIPPGFGPPPTSGYFANIFIDAAGFVTGATVQAVMELEVVSGTLYHAQIVINHAGSDKTIDCNFNGGLGFISEALPLTAGGWLATPPWASSGATGLLRYALRLWGNCTIRIGRFGVYTIP